MAHSRSTMCARWSTPLALIAMIALSGCGVVEPQDWESATSSDEMNSLESSEATPVGDVSSHETKEALEVDIPEISTVLDEEPCLEACWPENLTATPAEDECACQNEEQLETVIPEVPAVLDEDPCREACREAFELACEVCRRLRGRRKRALCWAAAEALYAACLARCP